MMLLVTDNDNKRKIIGNAQDCQVMQQVSFLLCEEIVHYL